MPDPAPRRKRFLFVDDDATFLSGITEVLSGLADGTWDIRTAQNHSQALAALREPVDVVVLDVNMPVMDGLEFLRLLRRTHPAQQIVMLTGEPRPETRKACLDLGAALFLEKLVTPEGFAAVFAALDALADTASQTGFRGMMRRVVLQDVLQMECLGRKSSILEVFTGKIRGRIYLEDGSIIHAETGTLQGEVALYGLLALRGGEFNLLPFSLPAQRSISGHYEFLLMEAARLRDEGTSVFIAEAEGMESPVPAASGQARAEPERGEGPGGGRIAEMVLCSGAGEVLYQQECPDLDRRLGLLAQVEQQAADLAGLLPVGRFERIEIHGPHSRTVCVIQPNMRLLVRGSRSSVTLK